MTETEIAQAIAAGELPSPQSIGNAALFALRITGTGMAYRLGHDEFVWRDPSIYLNDEFLTRCSGLPVTWEHPDKGVLSSDEFAKRSIGAICLPYLKGDEVWGVARIYDADAIAALADGQLSTSPAVVFDPATNSTVEAPDGRTILIEGKPTLIDSLAIVSAGVWDKGGSSAGVDSTKGNLDMTDEEKKVAEEAKTRADAEVANGEKLDKVLTGIDSLSKRVDAIEKRCDAMTGGVGGEEGGVPVREKGQEAPKPAADTAEGPEHEAMMADAQMRADSVCQSWGESARRPLAGETVRAYETFMARRFKRHSREFADIDPGAITDPAAFKAVIGKIYADAQAASVCPDVPVGVLRMIRKTDPETGQVIREFHGDAAACWDRYKSPTRRVTAFLTPQRAA